MSKKTECTEVSFLIQKDIKISPPNELNKEIPVSSILKNYNNQNDLSKMGERISKISFFLGKIFEKQLNKIERNYSTNKEKKSNHASVYRINSVDKHRKANLYDRSNSRTHLDSKESKIVDLSCNIKERKEFKQSPKEEKYNFYDSNSLRSNYKTEKIKTKILNIINNKNEEENSILKDEISVTKNFSTQNPGLPPKFKRPPKSEFIPHDTTNTKSINKKTLRISNYNFSIENKILKIGEHYSFMLEKNIIETNTKMIEQIKTDPNKYKDKQIQKNDLTICLKQETLSIKNEKYQPIQEMTLNFQPIRIREEEKENILKNKSKANNQIHETITEKLTNKLEENKIVATYSKPKLKCSSYRSNKENSNSLSNMHLNNSRIDYKLNSLTNENSQNMNSNEINSKNNINEINIEKDMISHTKIPSLNSTFLEYDMNKLNKIRIVSNKPSMNISHIENESFDETLIHKNSQCLDVNGVSYISEGIRGFINTSQLDKSKIEEKYQPLKPQIHNNNSSILNIQSSNHHKYDTIEHRQLNTENSSMSILKEAKKGSNINDYVKNRKILDQQLNKDFESFRLKRNKTYASEDDLNYHNHDNLNKFIEINHVNTLSFNNLDFKQEVNTLIKDTDDNLQEFPFEDSLCKNNNSKNSSNILRKEQFTETKIQRLKSYKSIKLSNVDNMIDHLPDKLEALNSADLKVI